METGRRYFTESCKTITTHATITDGIYPSVFTITITNRYIYQYLIEFSNIYRPCHNHRQIFRWWLPWKYRRNDFVGNVLARIFFLSCFAVCKIVGGWFFLFLTESVTKWGITNDQYSDGRIPSGKMLLTDFVPYTDRFNPSVKLFNGVVIKADHAQDRLLSSIKW